MNQYIYGNISIPEFLKKYRLLSWYIKGYVTQRKINVHICEAIPVAIDRILVTINGAMSVLCIVHRMQGGVEGAYLMNELADLTEVVQLLRQAEDNGNTVALKKGIDMIAIENFQRIAGAAVHAKQRFEFLWEELKHEKLKRYIRALERVEVRGRVTGEGDKME